MLQTRKKPERRDMERRLSVVKVDGRGTSPTPALGRRRLCLEVSVRVLGS